MDATDKVSIDDAADVASELAPDPLVPVQPRADGWTPDKQRAFLETLAACGSVTKAARSVGMTREGAYALRRRGDARAFVQAWDAARALAVEHLTEVAWDRALEGELRPVFYHGEQVGEIRHHDNRLLLALIAQNRLGAGAALPSPALVERVAADWEGALERVESGEALAEPEQPEDEIAALALPADDGEAIPPPLPAVRDMRGEALTEAQTLEVGLYRHWWNDALDCWLTNWPAPEDFAGAEYAVAADSEDEPTPWPADAVREEGDEDRWARVLTDEEQAGLAAFGVLTAGWRAERLGLYRRAHFGLASPAERASLAAANAGDGRWARARISAS